MRSKSTQRKHANNENTSRGKVSKQNLVNIAQKSNWEAKRNVLLSEKGLQLLAVFTPRVFNHLS